MTKIRADSTVFFLLLAVCFTASRSVGGGSAGGIRDAPARSNLPASTQSSTRPPPSCVCLASVPLARALTPAADAARKRGTAELRLRGGSNFDQHSQPGPACGRGATTVLAQGDDCSGDEALARRLHEQEVRAARAAGRTHMDTRRTHPSSQETGVDAARKKLDADLPLLESALLGDAESRALCRTLGDRGFVGTGPSPDLSEDDEAVERHASVSSRRCSPHGDTFLLSSIARVAWEGVHRVLSFRRWIAALGARCVPHAGEDAGDETRAVQGQVEEVEEGSGGARGFAGGGVEGGDECANDEAIAREMQMQEQEHEHEWIQALQHHRFRV
jgi:hypothetical protein